MGEKEREGVGRCQWDKVAMHGTWIEIGSVLVIRSLDKGF